MMPNIQSGWTRWFQVIGMAGVFALLGSAARAQAPTPEPVPYVLPFTETHTLHSTTVGDDFVIAVALPFGYETSDQSYPVLFAPDAEIGFAQTAQIARLMQLRQELPDFVVVGIGYGDLRTALVKRTRDLTPTHDPSHDACSAGIVACGGAGAFLQFIRTELMPYVASHYRVDIEDNAFMGFSLGGLFGLYVLFHEPEAFRRYLIGSPSIWWQEEVSFRYEKTYAAEHADLPARVFMSVGSLETEQMVANMNTMAERLSSRAYPGLILESMVFDGETHVSVPPAAASRGMRVLFRSEMRDGDK